MQSLADWPQQNPDELVYGMNYGQYKEKWFNAFLWTSRYNFFYCKIKFSNMFRNWEEPEWMLDWWNTFGLNPVGINLELTETARMFLQYPRRLDYLYNLFSDAEYNQIFIHEKHPWVLRTKFMIKSSEDLDCDPELLRQVYTQHWDPYIFNQFKDHPFD